MADDFSDFIAGRGPQPGRPLNGLTLLAVEDSRFACEAMRLMCLRSGARLRRADCLRSARRHLQAYRPAAVIVDLGLPDGSGLDLLRHLAAEAPRLPALIAISGDAGAAGAALAAGADGFLAKPDDLRAFQDAIRAALPAAMRPAAAPGQEGDPVSPDPLALRDDLAHAARMLGDGTDDGTLAYVAQFLSGIALAARDAPLRAAAEALAHDRRSGRATPEPLRRVGSLIRDRLAAGGGF